MSIKQLRFKQVEKELSRRVDILPSESGVSLTHTEYKVQNMCVCVQPV